MKKINLLAIVAPLMMAILLISCNNPSSLSKDYANALEKKNFKKAAKAMEKAADKYISWSSEQQDEYLNAIDAANNKFFNNCSDNDYEKYYEAMDNAEDLLDNAIDKAIDEEWGDTDDDWD